MTLYKNVDICDLESIVKNGILSLDDCRNDNWDDGKRADNDTSVVYLFSSTSEKNAFPDYGTALIEVECDAKEKEMEDTDAHKGEYREYIVEKVLPEQIKRVIIPEIFRDYVEIPEGLDVEWCGLTADYYGEDGLQKAKKEILIKFARTAELMDSTYMNFFRGKNEDGTMIDLYNAQYIF